MSTTTEQVLYKVLNRDGRSFHGGGMAYSLPTRNESGEWTPGDWHEVQGALEMCSNGLHLTSDPAEWWGDGARCFVAEHEEPSISDGLNKVAVKRCRLLREVAGEELHPLRIFTAGEHSVSEGAVRAHGSATVRASDSATVRASDSATVRASGSATVRASDSATVRAYGSATVEASGSATVRAYDSATIEAHGSATVRAYDSATVSASGHATIVTPPHAGGHPTVEVLEHAVWIDRRSGKPVIHAVTGAEFRAVPATTEEHDGTR